LIAVGRILAAIAAFETVVRLQPDNAEALYNLGSLLADVPGRIPEAVKYLEAAMRLTPGDPAVHNNLGLALMGCRGVTPMPSATARQCWNWHPIRQMDISISAGSCSASRPMNVKRCDSSSRPRDYDPRGKTRTQWLGISGYECVRICGFPPITAAACL
jgi:hypothetical protein